MNSSAVLTEEYAMIDADINLLEDRQVQDSVPLAALPRLLRLGGKRQAAVGAVVVLRSFQILKEQLAEDLLLKCQVRIVFDIVFDQILVVIVLPWLRARERGEPVVVDAGRDSEASGVLRRLVCLVLVLVG